MSIFRWCTTEDALGYHHRVGAVVLPALRMYHTYVLLLCAKQGTRNSEYASRRCAGLGVGDLVWGASVLVCR